MPPGPHALNRQLRLVRNLSNWWLYYAVKLGVRSAWPLRFRARGGVEVEVPRSVYREFKSIFMKESYLRHLPPLPERPVVVDVGANVGFFALFVASRSPGSSIFCYEPLAANFRQLLRQLELNPGLEITARHRAVWRASGPVEIRHGDPGDGLSTSASLVGPPGEVRETVEALTLAEVFEAEGLDRVDLLKLDCEGSEFPILYECGQRVLDRVHRMAVEVHRGPGASENAESLAASLRTRGFEVTHDRGYLWAWRDRAATSPAGS